MGTGLPTFDNGKIDERGRYKDHDYKDPLKDTNDTKYLFQKAGSPISITQQPKGLSECEDRNISFEVLTGVPNPVEATVNYKWEIFDEDNSILDRSHPVNFGYSDNQIPIFRNTNIFIKNDTIGYNNPIKYTKSPLISGYISKENLISIKNSRPFYTTTYGKGRVSVFTDNTNFRAFWYGTNKLTMNAIFFADMM